MGTCIDTADNPILQEGLQDLCEAVINPLIVNFGSLTSLSYTNSVLTLTCTLLGMEDVPVTVSVGSIEIADDGSSVMFKNFKANKLFLENALNTFATGPFQVPQDKATRAYLKIAKGLLG
ncbi:MAG: hypothetical protein IJU76_05095 [Desulfovibrionaceae bacterium]|nr:hypothetical protein [Desulfovibrionaceae bacterium]